MLGGLILFLGATFVYVHFRTQPLNKTLDAVELADESWHRAKPAPLNFPGRQGKGLVAGGGGKPGRPWGKESPIFPVLPDSGGNDEQHALMMDENDEDGVGEKLDTQLVGGSRPRENMNALDGKNQVLKEGGVSHDEQGGKVMEQEQQGMRRKDQLDRRTNLGKGRWESRVQIDEHPGGDNSQRMQPLGNRDEKYLKNSNLPVRMPVVGGDEYLNEGNPQNKGLNRINSNEASFQEIGPRVEPKGRYSPSHNSDDQKDISNASLRGNLEQDGHLRNQNHTGKQLYVNSRTPTGRTLSIQHTERQKAVVKAFKHAWKGYTANAWGKDELNPVSHSSSSYFGLGLTLVDSLDTMWLMGLEEEFARARDWLETSFNIDDNHNTVSLFETTIRVLGGLLSAYHLSEDKIFLDRAVSMCLYVSLCEISKHSF